MLLYVPIVIDNNSVDQDPLIDPVSCVQFTVKSPFYSQWGYRHCTQIYNFVVLLIS